MHGQTKPSSVDVDEALPVLRASTAETAGMHSHIHTDELSVNAQGGSLQPNRDPDSTTRRDVRTATRNTNVRSLGEAQGCCCKYGSEIEHLLAESTAQMR